MEPKEQIRARINLPDCAIIVGWLGRLVPIKRPDRVIEIAKDLNNIIFLIGGDGELLSNLEKDLPANVKLLGWTRPEEIWSLSDIALLTSDNEAQPISLIEAGLAGIPAVAESVGSVSEVIENGATGFLVTNLEERIEAINTLAKDRDLRLKMGARAKIYCENKFGHKQFLDTHLEAYKTAIRRRDQRL
jgi:glycosyltransferase involved in cell wall biosynthesis